MVTSNHEARLKRLGVMVVGAGGCLAGGPTLPALPGTGGTEGPTGGGVTSEAGVTVAATEATSVTDTNAGVTTGETTSVTGADEGSTGPVAVCGNGVVEDGEACDGMDWAGASCEGLGYTAGTLACSECGFDASDCGAPVGMVRVPGGVFEMGSEDGDPSFAPVRYVNVDTFFIDIEEVTVEEYSECVSEMGCALSPDITINPYYCNYMVAGKEDHPINCVSWYEAVEYCEWAGGRLPTEAEWERAARGQDARLLPWVGPPGSLDCTRAWMDDGGYGYGCMTDSTGSVGTKSPGDTPEGVSDMAGNVAEWVSDWYAQYDALETDNPTGPMTGEYHITRGGGFSDGFSTYFHTYYRWPRGGMNRFYEVGFRCVWDPAEG